MEGTIRELPVSQIELDPNQPRKEAGDLEGLKRSIQADGIVQPPGLYLNPCSSRNAPMPASKAASHSSISLYCSASSASEQEDSA
jgi:hypothetical protein